MGNCNNDSTIKEKNEKESQNKIKFSDFTKLYPIGKSGISTTWKAQLIEKGKQIINNNKNFFAMKIINKAKIYIKKIVKSIENNRRLMENLIINYYVKCIMLSKIRKTYILW